MEPGRFFVVWRGLSNHFACLARARRLPFAPFGLAGRRGRLGSPPAFLGAFERFREIRLNRPHQTPGHGIHLAFFRGIAVIVAEQMEQAVGEQEAHFWAAVPASDRALGEPRYRARSPRRPGCGCRSLHHPRRRLRRAETRARRWACPSRGAARFSAWICASLVSSTLSSACASSSSTSIASASRRTSEGSSAGEPGARRSTEVGIGLVA